MVRRALITAALTLATAGMVATSVVLAQGTTTSQSAQTPKRPAQPTPQPGVSAPVNLNTATAAELEALPGVGPAMAARIVEYRQKNGSFKKVEDLMQVKGIAEKTFLKLKPLVTVSPIHSSER